MSCASYMDVIFSNNCHKFGNYYLLLDSNYLHLEDFMLINYVEKEILLKVTHP